jgi:hypothetical protein
VSTSVQVFSFGVAPVGALLAGLIASHAGARVALWVMLGALPLSSLVLLAGPLPRLRDLPPPPVPPTAGSGTAKTSSRKVDKT